MYFAHLQTQDVEEAMIIEAGQKIGTIGNTGTPKPRHRIFTSGFISGGRDLSILFISSIKFRLAFTHRCRPKHRGSMGPFE